jgi:hypothetical protein
MPANVYKKLGWRGFRRGTESSSVPVLLAPLAVVRPPSLDQRTAAVKSFLLSLSTLVDLVTVETLPPKFGFLGLFHNALIRKSVNIDFDRKRCPAIFQKVALDL